MFDELQEVKCLKEMEDLQEEAEMCLIPNKDLWLSFFVEIVNALSR